VGVSPGDITPSRKPLRRGDFKALHRRRKQRFLIFNTAGDNNGVE
jgi:hypothetical protein